MDRRELAAALAAHNPADADEAAMRDALIAFVEGSPRCFDRSYPPGHVTASAWIVDRARQHVLLVHHRKLGRWLQPGGHLEDADASLLDGALREAREESGLTQITAAGGLIFDVDIHRIPDSPKMAAHLHYDIRCLLEADSAEAPVCSDESHAVRWFTLDELSAMEPDASMRRMVGKIPAPPPARSTGG